MTDKEIELLPNEIWIEQGCSTFQKRDHTQDFGRQYYRYTRARPAVDVKELHKKIISEMEILYENDEAWNQYPVIVRGAIICAINHLSASGYFTDHTETIRSLEEIPEGSTITIAKIAGKGWGYNVTNSDGRMSLKRELPSGLDALSKSVAALGKKALGA